MMTSGKMITVGQLALLGLGVALLSAQQQEPTFRAVTRLVEVTVTVVVDTSALEFLPDGENLKANLEMLIGDNAADGLARASRSAVTSTVPAARWETARQQATRFDGMWKPASDATALRVIVHDVNSGRHGSLDVPLGKVPRDRPN